MVFGMGIKSGISRAIAAAKADISKRAKSVSTHNEISNVARIAANNDKVIGDMISAAMKEVGQEGVITVEEGTSLENELEIVDGMRFDKGFLSPLETDNACLTLGRIFYVIMFAYFADLLIT